MGKVFQAVAAEPMDLRRSALGLEMWRIFKKVDATWDQMGVDDALKTLGLIRPTPEGYEDDYGKWSAFDEKFE